MGRSSEVFQQTWLADAGEGKAKSSLLVKLFNIA